METDVNLDVYGWIGLGIVFTLALALFISGIFTFIKDLKSLASKRGSDGTQ